jgi:hypothetical protein
MVRTLTPAGSGHLALAVETYVSQERGRWVVEVVVVFTDEAVRRRINDYPSRRHAEIAAAWIKRGSRTRHRRAAAWMRELHDRHE